MYDIPALCVYSSKKSMTGSTDNCTTKHLDEKTLENLFSATSLERLSVVNRRGGSFDYIHSWVSLWGVIDH